MQIKLHILKITILDILEETTINATITIRDNVDYKTQEHIQTLKENIAHMYDVEPQEVMTELEYQHELLKVARIGYGTAKDIFENSSQQGGDTHEIKSQVLMQDLTKKARNSLNATIRKITKLEKNYDKQGLWRET